MLSASFHSFAEIGDNAFFERSTTKANEGQIIYETKLNSTQNLVFVVDKLESSAVAQLHEKGKIYRAISIRYCIAETSDCWVESLYSQSFSSFVYQLKNDSMEYDLVWSIDYLNNNKLEMTDVSQIGVLNIFADLGDTDEGNLYLYWDNSQYNYP